MNGFTLIEMLVVIGIIVVLTALTLISIPGMLTSTNQNQCIQTIESALITAQATSVKYRTRCGIRIERAYKEDKDGFMVKDNNGDAIYLNYQRIKIVILGIRQTGLIGYNDSKVFDESWTLRKIKDSSVLELPKNFWVTTESAINKNSEVYPKNASKYDTFDNCYVLFDFTGKLHSFSDFMYYIDEDQPYYDGSGTKIPVVEFPEASSRSLYIYNREEFKSVGKNVSFFQINISDNGAIPK